MASSICSSSRQRALKPDRGWLLRQMAAWEEARGTQTSYRIPIHRCFYLDLHLEKKSIFVRFVSFPAHLIVINQPQCFSYLHLVATREWARHCCVILPSGTSTRVVLFVWTEPHMYPQPLKADLTHIKHSQLLSQVLIGEIMNVCIVFRSKIVALSIFFNVSVHDKMHIRLALSFKNSFVQTILRRSPQSHQLQRERWVRDTICKYIIENDLSNTTSDAISL